MAESSGISWTDATFNPWMGCTKVSPACKNCYAERDMDHRYGKVQWGPMGTRVVTSESYWNKPVKWNKEAAAKGVRMRVFCASLADVFEDWTGAMFNHKSEYLWYAGDGWTSIPGGRALDMDHVRRRLFRLIDATPNLDWLLLTKRPENILKMWHCVCCNDTGSHVFNVKHRPNVWLGTTAESQEWADKRLPELLKCRDLAPVLFLSCEPMVGPIDLSLFLGKRHEWNDQIDGAVCLSSSDCGRTGDRRTGSGVASGEAWLGSLEQMRSPESLQAGSSGTPISDGLSASSCDVPESSIQRTSASARMVSSQRGNPRESDRQSQGWGEAQQLPDKPRTGDGLRATDSRKQGSGDGSGSESVRREESRSQVDNGGCGDDSGHEGSRELTEDDSSRIRHCVSDSVENSQSYTSQLWVICGGESGPEARPHHPSWFRSLRDQCADAGVPYHFKQWGEWLPVDDAIKLDLTTTYDGKYQPYDHSTGTPMLRVGVNSAGRLLDGQLHDAFPVVTA